MRLLKLFTTETPDQSERRFEPRPSKKEAIGSDSRPQIPVSDRAKSLNTDDSYVKISRNKAPTLSASEIMEASDSTKTELLGRYGRYLNTLAGTAAGTVAADKPDDFEASHNGFSVKVDGKGVEISDGDRTARIGGGKPHLTGQFPEGIEGFLTVAFENLLVQSGEGHPTAEDVDENVAQLYLHLLGPAGTLTGKSDAVFGTPKLLAYDLNGTAENRPGMASVTATLNDMGAASIITTSISAEGGERSMTKAGAPFTGYHGGSEVRPGGGNKVYAPVAGAYGIPEDQMKHQVAVIGDSRTDAPGDVPDVLFVHNSNRTPAEVLQVLFAELDRIGEGSFYQAVQKLGESKSKKKAIGPIVFELETKRFSGNEVPTISELGVRFSADDLAAALSSKSDHPTAAALKTLAERYLAGMDDRAFAAAAGKLSEAGVDLSEQVQSRVARRQETVDWAKGEVKKLLRDARKLNFREFSESAQKVAQVGDSGVLDTLKAAVEAFSTAERARAPKRQRAAQDLASEVKQAVDGLIDGADQVAFPKEDGWRAKSASSKVQGFIDGGVPSSRRDREAIQSLFGEAQSLAGQTHEEDAVDLVDGSLLLELVASFEQSASEQAAKTEQRIESLGGVVQSGDAAVTAQDDVWRAIGQAVAGS